MKVELDGEERAYILRLLKRETEQLSNVSNLMIREKDRRL